MVEAYLYPLDLDSAWSSLKDYAPIIRSFVSRGGKYMGFCLGAYLAGHSPGFGLIPSAADTDSEICQPGAQVSTEEDTVIQVDWTFKSEGDDQQNMAGRTDRKRWLYFQDGAMINGLPVAPKPVRRRGINDGSGKPTAVWARYSKTGNVAASLTSYGQGWVALVGPHPEATEEWCKLSSPLARPYLIVSSYCQLTGCKIIAKSTKTKKRQASKKKQRQCRGARLIKPSH